MQQVLPSEASEFSQLKILMDFAFTSLVVLYHIAVPSKLPLLQLRTLDL